MTLPCPGCSSDNTCVYSTRRLNLNATRRHRVCHDCGNKWGRVEDRAGNPVDYTPPSRLVNNDPFTEAEVIAVLEATNVPHLEMARRIGKAAESIRKIRFGMSYRDVAPWVERWQVQHKRPSCRRCIQWDHRIDIPEERFPLGTPCRFGFPDPIVESTRFARDCNCYHPDETLDGLAIKARRNPRDRNRSRAA